MHPILIQFGSITFYTYGLFLAAGFLAGVALARHDARRVGIVPDRIVDLSFCILVSSIVGARLFYVITAPDAFRQDPIDILKFWQGGLVFYGGFLGAVLAAVICVRHYRLGAGRTADVLAPAIALGQTLGRLGCFFAGCCYGKTCELPWAVTFRHPETLAPQGVPLHPTQLYSAAANGMIFLFLWGFRKRSRFAGQVFSMYLLLYGVSRFTVEWFRGDFRGDTLFHLLSISQVLALGSAVIGLMGMIMIPRLSGHHAETAPKTPAGRKRHRG